MPRTGTTTSTPTQRAPISLFQNQGSGNGPTALSYNKSTETLSWDATGEFPTSQSWDKQNEDLTWQ